MLTWIAAVLGGLAIGLSIGEKKAAVTPTTASQWTDWALVLEPDSSPNGVRLYAARNDSDFVIPFSTQIQILVLSYDGRVDRYDDPHGYWEWFETRFTLERHLHPDETWTFNPIHVPPNHSVWARIQKDSDEHGLWSSWRLQFIYLSFGDQTMMSEIGRRETSLIVQWKN